ncbi:MAG TPA: hypothetical protein VFO79_06280 [Xanthomonadales bacterium]|nr:hypothetical protein [Xanthomonadales bacterium]
MKLAAIVLATTVLAGCGQDPIEVKTSGVSDYNRSALHQAVDKFVADGRTPAAYRELSETVMKLRPGFDRAIGEEAELKMLVLALAPVQSVAAKPMAEQVEELALTVWPTLLGQDIRADRILINRDARWAEFQPKQGEVAREYLQRLCGTVLAGECKQVVPEYQGAAVSAFATRRATERVRDAISNCVTCDSDPGWRESVRTWESLDRLANGSIHEIERKASPDNWPIAGAAAQAGAELPDATAIWREAEINATGEVVVGGQRYGALQRIDALRDLRGESSTITLHLRPDLSLAVVKGILADAKKSGASKVAVVARAPHYPWERKIYWLGDSGLSANLRPTDSLQLLLHTIDHVGSPGVVARVD